MPIELTGDWGKGFAYDVHMEESIFLGYDEYGHPRFENHRSQMGELVYQLKYENREENARIIANLLKNTFTGFEHFNYIIPAPFSTPRAIQPVERIAEELSQLTNIPVANILRKRSNSTPMKNINGKDEKLNTIANSIEIYNEEIVKNSKVLLLDDLFSSGSTISESTQILKDHGAYEVCVIVMTKTKR